MIFVGLRMDSAVDLIKLFVRSMEVIDLYARLIAQRLYVTAYQISLSRENRSACRSTFSICSLSSFLSLMNKGVKFLKKLVLRR